MGIQGGSEVEDTTKALVDIQIQLARIEKTLEAIPTLTATLEMTKDLSREAMQSAKSAHLRLDKIEEGQKWLWRTVGGSGITLVMGGLAALINKIGGG